MFKELKKMIQYKRFKTAYIQAFSIEMAMWEVFPDDRRMPKMNLPAYRDIKNYLGNNKMIKFDF